MTDLFGQGEWWEEHWRGMPAFEQENMMPFASITMRFKTADDVLAFSRLVGKTIAEQNKETLSLWYPDAEVDRWNKSWVSPRIDPKYPVYIISKGRWESRMTSKALERMGVPYMIAVEPQEADRYAAVIDRAKILVLPFSNLGHGSIPARNFIWEHAIKMGAERHWCLDDNMSRFMRLHCNSQATVTSGAAFRAIEDFADRYENVAIAGMNYDTFVTRRRKCAPFKLNTRIYSCILIRNDLPHRWRGRYNEDTDLSLRVLKDGLVTVLFDAFMVKKHATMSMKGGNTDELYKDDGRKLMADSLKAQHPDVTTVEWRWGRWQHVVDYRPFRKNRLAFSPDAEIPDGPNEYGMVLKADEESKCEATA